MNKRKLVFFLCLVMGLALMNYPFVSQWVNGQNQTRVVRDYVRQTDSLQEEVKQQLLQEARAYNTQLAAGRQQLSDGFAAGQKSDAQYDKLLNPGGDGIMGYIEIPAIGVMLPIYHGTGADALQHGVGHLVQSSLPVGGTDTHAVLSAHTGLAENALFTNLDRMQVGDTFTLHILGEALYYRVCDITTVLPYETDSLAIQPGRDLVTLVTCTPYGINSHRLLVTGERWEQADADEAQSTQQPGIKNPGQRGALLFGGSILLLLVCGVLLAKPEKKGGKQSNE